jgi:hypothetical protein
MCNFKSAIVLRNGDLLHNPFLDSHEDLIELFNLRDNGLDHFVRVEYTTSERKDIIENYKLNIDETSVPEWFEEFRERITDQLKCIVNNMIIREDRKFIIDECIILAPGVTIDKIQHCVILEMRENSTVNTMRENSTVNTMLGNSTVKTMWGNSTVNTMLGNSTVNTMQENSTVNTMRENSTVKENSSKNKLPK